MIEKHHLKEWFQNVRWLADHQVEQDLIISRALVSLLSKRTY